MEVFNRLEPEVPTKLTSIGEEASRPIEVVQPIIQTYVDFLANVENNAL